MKKHTLLVTLSIALSIADASASGGAPGRIIRGGKSTSDSASMDSATYALGQQVYEGKAVVVSGSGDPAAQKPRLAKVTSMVSDQSKAQMLTSLAGKLSANQLSALEYYVMKRFAR